MAPKGRGYLRGRESSGSNRSMFERSASGRPGLRSRENAQAEWAAARGRVGQSRGLPPVANTGPGRNISVLALQPAATVRPADTAESQPTLRRTTKVRRL